MFYRTGDGGATMVKKNKEFNEMMQETMFYLNLQPHICGASKGKTKRLWSAADIEGHVGADGKVWHFLFLFLFLSHFLIPFLCLPLSHTIIAVLFVRF